MAAYLRIQDMFLYRVDIRRYNNGDDIEPRTTFEDIMNSSQAQVEKKLDELKPCGVPNRKECLYLFYDLSSALIFCSKYGGNIYAVSIENEDLHWRADMNMLDNIHDIFKITECEDIRAAVIRRYWEAGSHTFQPCYELLVRKAKVISIILDDANAQSLIKAEIDRYGTIEKTPIFRSIFLEVSSENKVCQV